MSETRLLGLKRRASHDEGEDVVTMGNHSFSVTNAEVQVIKSTNNQVSTTPITVFQQGKDEILLSGVESTHRQSAEYVERGGNILKRNSLIVQLI
jgi:hypothetical protein